MRKALKFAHTVASMALVAGLLFLLFGWHAIDDSSDARALYLYYSQSAVAARWLILPGMISMILSGMLSMMVGTGFYNAGWVWAKLALGLSVFEGTLLTIQGPAQKAGAIAAQYGRQEVDASALLSINGPNELAIFAVLSICLIATGIGIWRPRFTAGKV